MDSEVENIEKTGEKVIEGNDHYARFFRFLQDYTEVEPEKYGDLLKKGLSVKMFVEDMEIVFDALADYIRGEIDKRLGGNVPVSVRIMHDSDFKWHYLLVETSAKIGDEYYPVRVVDKEIAKWDHIASSREDFNSLVENAVNTSVEKIRKVMANNQA